MTPPRAETGAPTAAAGGLQLLCLSGPTACGKTAAALAIVQALQGRQPVEIVSVDSALVYRGMDIGTAKPSAEERALAPHHLIDVIDANEAYSAARFASDARRLIGEIQGRGALPLLVGGTLMYFKALFDGLDEMPASDAAVRAELAQALQQHGLPALHARLREVDPLTADRLPPGDTQRILRALEVQRLSGRPLSSFHRRQAATDLPPLISLEPVERVWLHERIAQRFERMLAQGLLDEVRTLMRRGDLHAELPSMRCVGYRQAWELLSDGADGASSALQAAPTPEQLTTFKQRGCAATRQLAKRQLTWLRGMPHRHVVPADAPDALERTVRLAVALVEGLASTHHGTPEATTATTHPTPP